MKLRYFTTKYAGKTHRFFWSTQASIGKKVPTEGKAVFIVKHEVKNYFGKWEVLKYKEYRKRWKAKDWCYKQLCTFTGKPFVSLHKVSDKKKEHGKRLQKILKEKKEQNRKFKNRKTAAFGTVGTKRKIIKRRKNNDA